MAESVVTSCLSSCGFSRSIFLINSSSMSRKSLILSCFSNFSRHLACGVTENYVKLQISGSYLSQSKPLSTHRKFGSCIRSLSLSLLFANPSRYGRLILFLLILQENKSEKSYTRARYITGPTNFIVFSTTRKITTPSRLTLTLKKATFAGI